MKAKLSFHFPDNSTITLTKRQRDILMYIDAFRFVTIKQLQRLCNHKDKKRIRKWIQYLEKNGLIQKATYSDTSTFPMSSWYCLAPLAKHYFTLHENIKRDRYRWLYKEAFHTPRFMYHHKVLLETYLLLKERATPKNITLSYWPKRTMKEFNFLPEILPDAMIGFKEENRPKKYYFIEILDPFTPIRSHRERLNNLLDYYGYGSWEEAIKRKFPSLLFICPNKTVQYLMSRYAKSEVDDEDYPIRCYFVLSDDILQSNAFPIPPVKDI